MCGIAGVLSADPELRARVARMTDAIAHRGPDDAGLFDDGRCALGHRRLSIIDIAGGHQPLGNLAGDVTIVFNGEIYNYRELRTELERDGYPFRTRTDTEVILALYEREGERCVRRLRGMFAFAIRDARRGRLVLARDRMGQKPLFYHLLPGGGLAFASEVKGILAGGFVTPRPNLQALAHYISLRFVPDDHSLFEGVTKLPAAHTLVVEADGLIRLDRYWDVSYLEKATGRDAALLDEVDAVLGDAVRSHAVADVPVGAFLSGGIDSSLMTAMLARESRETPATFAIGVRDLDYDELPWARRVARHCGTRHHDEVVAADLVSLLPRMVYHLDEPSDPFAVGVYLVSRLARRHGAKVVLTGDGGDELFAGYDRFAGNRLVELYALVPAALRRTLIQAIADRLDDTFGYKGLPQKLRWANAMSLVSGGDRYALSMSFLRFTEEGKRALLTPDALASLDEPDSSRKILDHHDAACVRDAVDRMLHTDCMTRLPDHLLPIVDRMAMAHGVEARPPMVDHRVVELAARLPAHLKLRGRVLKYALRETARRYVPDEVVDRPKQGFGFPIARWMRHELRPVLERAFAESRMVAAGLFEPREMRRLLAEHVAGRRDHNFRLWILLNVELWHRIHVEREPMEHVTAWMRDSLGAHRPPVQAPHSMVLEPMAVPA